MTEVDWFNLNNRTDVKNCELKMKDIEKNYQLKKSELTIRNENEMKDEIYIYSRLSYSRSRIYDSIYLKQYRYR